MEIFRSEQAQTYNRFLQDNAETAGNRYYILSSLSLHTITDELLQFAELRLFHKSVNIYKGKFFARG